MITEPHADFSAIHFLALSAARHTGRDNLIELHLDPAAHTYSEASRRTLAHSLDDALRAAQVLLDWNVGPTCRVIIMAPNCAWHMLVHVACSAIGAITVPLDQHLQAGELAAILVNCEPDVIICGDAQIDRVERATALNPDADNASHPARQPRVVTVDQWSRAVAATSPLPLADVAALPADTVGAILYTSGTAAHPTGVTLTHENLWWGTRSFRDVFEYGPRTVEAVSVPLSHIGGFNGTTLDLAVSGGTVIIVDAFHPAALVEALGSYQVEMMFAVPTMYRMMCQVPTFTSDGLPSFTRPLIGGAPVPADLAAMLRERGLEPFSVWGMTEQAASGTCLVPGLPADRSTTSGFPFPHTRIGIEMVDGLDAHAVPVEGTRAGESPSSVASVLPPSSREGDIRANTIGELICTGPSVTNGYWNDEELNAASLRGPWLRTGDLGFIDEGGFVHIVGRKVATVNTGGEKVLPHEVEQVLTRMDGVRSAHVVGVPDVKWGEAVSAVLVMDEGCEAPSLHDVREFAGRYLARFKVPQRLAVVESLPVSSNGKVTVSALRAVFAPGD